MKKIVLIHLFFLTCLSNSPGQVWTNLINSVPFISDPDIYSAVVDSNSNILYLGGDFTRINNYVSSSIISYDGNVFDTLQSGMDDYMPLPHSGQVRQLVMFKGKLYAFGYFTRAGHKNSFNMASWDGTSWDSLRIKGAPRFAFKDGNNMIVMDLDSIEGIKVQGAARFNGVSWFDFPLPTTPGHIVDQIAYFQGKIYKSGRVNASTSDANLSYSDGTNWIPWVGVSGDGNKAIFGMTVIDTMLFVYGRFNSIAGTNCKGFAAYNGKNWYGYGLGLATSGWETVYNVQKINGELYVMGNFDKIEGLSNSVFPQTPSLAKFDGEKWCLISPPIDNVVMGLVSFKNELYAYGAFNKIGPDTIRGIGKFNGGYPAICSNTLTIYMSTGGLTEQINVGSLKLFPNPVKEKLTVKFGSFELSGVKLELYNSLSQVLMTFNDLSEVQEIDLTGFSPGMYFIKTQKGSEQKTFKIIKE